MGRSAGRERVQVETSRVVFDDYIRLLRKATPFVR